MLDGLLLFEVFSHLQDPLSYVALDILSCMLVSKLWRTVCLEHIDQFSWYSVYHVKIVIVNMPNKCGTYEPVRLLDAQFAQNSSSQLISITTETNKPGVSATWKLNTSLKESMNRTMIDMFKEKSSLYRAVVMFDHYGGRVLSTKMLHVICQINISQLMAMRRELTAREAAVISDCMRLHNYKHEGSIFEGELPYENKAKLPSVTQPQGFPPTFTFSSMQLRTLSWLLSVENSDYKVRCDRGVVIWYTLLGPIFFRNGRIIKPIHVTRDSTDPVKGGVLIVNAGKEAYEILGLILATHAIRKEANSTFPGVTPTNTTLVLCARNEHENWSKNMKIATTLKVLTFASARAFSESSIKEICAADIVVVAAHELVDRKRRVIGLTDFFWKRIIIVNQIDTLWKTLYLQAHHWWIVAHPKFSKRHVTLDRMGFLDVPGYYYEDFAARFVWDTTHLRDSSKVFVYENIPIELNGLELLREQQGLVEIPFKRNQDTVKVEMIASLKEAIAKQAETSESELLAKLVTAYALLLNTKEMYTGPNTSPASVMHSVSDLFLGEVLDVTESDVLRVANANNITVEDSVPTKQPEKSAASAFFNLFRKSLEPETNEDKKTTEQPVQTLTKENERKFLINEFWSKSGLLLCYLRDLWKRDPCARVFIYASNTEVRMLFTAFSEIGISTGVVVANDNVDSRLPIYTKSKNTVRVFLASTVPYNTNSFEVSHVFFLDQIPADCKIILAAAKPQGYRDTITIVRMFFLHSEEHHMLYKNKLIHFPANRAILYANMPNQIDGNTEEGKAMARLAYAAWKT